MNWLAIGGIFAGVVARALFPWVRKLRRGEVEDFDTRYLYSALGALISGVIITLLIFPQFELTVEGQDMDARLRLLATAFGFGFGWKAIVNEAGKWAGAFEPTGASDD